MKALPCTKCKKPPTVLPAGNCMCPRCKVSATTMDAWNRFMKVEDIGVLVEALERPVSVLKAVQVLSTDSGLKELAATTLKSLGDLDFSEFFSDPKEAKAHAEQLKEKLSK